MNANLPLAALAFFAILLLAGCATGHNALQQGRYNKAVTLSTKHLGNYPNSNKASEVLGKAYAQGRQKWLNKVQQATTSDDVFRWEELVKAYSVLNSWARKIDESPVARSLGIDYGFYYGELKEAKLEASKVREREGDEFLAMGGLLDARDAYWHYAKALEFTPRVERLARKKREALDSGTITVALKPVESYDREISPVFLEYEIVERLAGRSIDKFVKLLPYADRGNAADHYLSVALTQADIGRTSESCSSRQYTKEIEKKNPDDPSKPLIEKVTAKVTEFERRKYSYAVAEFRIIDGYGEALLYSEKARGDAEWSSEWSKVEGDKRAYSGRSRSSCGIEPSDSSQRDEVISDLARVLKNRLRGYYRNYGYSEAFARK